MHVTRWAVALALVAAACAVPQKAARRPTVRETNRLIEQAKQLMAQGKYPEMKDSVAQVVEAVRVLKGPSSAEYAQWLGVQGAVDIALHDYANAEARYRAALGIAEHPARPLRGAYLDLPFSCRMSLGNVLLMAGKLDAARAELEELAAEDAGWSDAPTKVLARFMLGISEWLSGRRPEGRKRMQEAREMAGNLSGISSDLITALDVMFSMVEAMHEDGRRLDPSALDRAEKTMAANPAFGPLVPWLRMLQGAAEDQNDDPAVSRQRLLDSLQQQRVAIGDDHPDNAIPLNMLAGVERELGHWDAAEDDLKEQERILTKAFRADSEKVAEAVRDRAQLRELRGDAEEAAELIARVRRIQAAALPPDHIEWAGTFHLEAELAEQRGDLDEAEVLERKALALWRRQYPDGHPLIADALAHLVKVLLLEGKAKTCEAMVEEALAIRRKAYTSGRKEFALALVFTAIYRQDTGELRTAHGLLDEALRSIPDGTNWSKAMRSLVRVYLAVNFVLEVNPAQADALLKQAQPMISALPFGEGVQAEYSRLIGVVRAELGQYVEAEAPLRQALVFYQRRGLTHPDAIRTAFALGVVMRNRGDDAEADALLSQVYDDVRRSGRQSLLAAQLAASRALILLDRNDDRNAETVLREAIRIMEQERGAAYFGLVEPLIELAGIRSRAGDRKEAGELRSRAEEIAVREIDPQHPVVAEVRSAQAWDLLLNGKDKGSAEEAARLAAEALRLATARYGPDHPLVSSVLGTLAIARWAAGDLEGARNELRERAGVEARNFSRWVILGDETGYSNLLERMSSTDLYVSFHFNALPSSQEAAELAFWAVLQRKGTLQDIMAEHARIEHQSSAGAAAIARWKDRERAVTGCMSSPTRPALIQADAPAGPDCVQGILAREVAAGEAFQQALNSVPSLAEAAKPVEIAALAERLRKTGEFSLIEIVQYLSEEPRNGKSERRYAAYVLLPDGRVNWAALGSQTEVDDAVAQLRTMQSNPSSDLAAAQQAAQRLYRLTMRPIRPLLEGRTRLFVAADGDLNLIDFSSLVDENGNALLDRYLIAGLTSGRDLLRLNRMTSSAAGREDHLFGNPSYLADIPARPAVSMGSGEAGTVAGCPAFFEKREWGQIALSPDGQDDASPFHKAIPGLQAHVRENATKAALLGIEHPRSVWLLTHGFFCEDQAKRADSTHPSNAMELGALVLAGAGSDDPAIRRRGLVQAFEIAGLNWTGADLVVLGACETALGAPRVGDGVYGLRRAVTLAGARSQVMTLWKVAPASSILLLADFAARMSRGTPRLQALREAQNEARKTHPHPFYWAGFYYIGDPGER